MIVADTIDAEEAFGKKPITQVPLEQCEQIDTCSIAKFAVVSKGGKQGIYDLEKHENVTEIDLDVAGFSRRYVSEDGIEVFYFYVEKGLSVAPLAWLEEPIKLLVYGWTILNMSLSLMNAQQ